jgi:glutathione synthase/RimK-type ligase-like ATP-grasp enzyme
MTSVGEHEVAVILVVSHPADDHAAAVLAALESSGHPAVLLDTGSFPINAFLTERFSDSGRSYEFSTHGQIIDFTTCRAGWWRRPQPFTLQSELASEVVSFTYSECHEAVAGLWSALNLKWVNPPALDEVAHHKPYQLAIATEVGLPIPRTVITNNPDVARRFIDELAPERTVYKTFLASEECWRETRVVRPHELELLDRVSLAPVIFQEYVSAVADVRVTVVGDRMFAAEIRAAPGGYDIDYRMDINGADFQPTELAIETQGGIRRLMERLGLVYGAIDFRRTERGDVFLEINPAGEWLFVEERTAQPITRALAELLADLDR